MDYFDALTDKRIDSETADLVDRLLERHADAYFQLFTNGHFLSAEVAERLRRMGNVTPLISVEGLAVESDRRSGR